MWQLKNVRQLKENVTTKKNVTTEKGCHNWKKLCDALFSVFYAGKTGEMGVESKRNTLTPRLCDDGGAYRRKRVQLQPKGNFFIGK